MDQHTKINASLKWARIVFVTLFSIHLIGCIFYFIGDTNPTHNPLTWISLGEEQMKNEKHKGLFKYIMSVYWSTTVLSTVGYGDYHPVNGLEMAFGVISMFFYHLLNSYVATVMSELLQSPHQRTQFKGNSEALRNFVITHKLQDGLHQEMYKFLVKARDNQISKPFDIKALFPEHMQFQVKSAFSGKIAQSYLFRGVSPTLIHSLVAEMELVTFEAQELVLLANDYTKKLYILVEGGIQGINLTNPTLSVCGEFGAIFGLPLSYSVRTNQKSTLLSLTQKKFMKLMEFNRQDGPTIGLNILQNLRNQGGDPILGAIYDQVIGKFNRGETILHLDIQFACRWVFPKLLLQLIKSGEDLEELDVQQRNILHIVLNEGRQRCELCVRILLREMSDAAVNQRDLTGKTPLCYAIDKQRFLIDLFSQRNVSLAHADVVQYHSKARSNNDLFLLETMHQLGCDINIVDSTQNTPLHMAVRENKYMIVAALLGWGADRNLVNGQGYTPAQLAESLGYLNIQQLLLGG